MLLLLKFVLLAILLECAVTEGVVVVAAIVVVVVDSIAVVVAAVGVPGIGGGVVAPFFKRMDFVADAVVILMLFLTLLCEYVIVISCFRRFLFQSFSHCSLLSALFFLLQSKSSFT